MADYRQDSQESDAEKRFNNIGRRLEKWFLRTGLLLAALLIVFQCLLRDPSIRSSLLRVDALEGVRYPGMNAGFHE